MYCTACGQTHQPDRVPKVLEHLNRGLKPDKGRSERALRRSCLVPELDYLLRHEPDVPDEPLDPTKVSVREAAGSQGARAEQGSKGWGELVGGLPLRC